MIDFRVVSRHPQLVPFKSSKILVDTLLNPNLMESYALRDMLQNSPIWDRINVFCSDGDVKDTAMLERFGVQCQLIRDPNHVIKTAFSKIVSKYPKLEKTFRIIFAADITQEQKIKRWLDLLAHYQQETEEHIKKREIILNLAPSKKEFIQISMRQ